MNKSDRKFIRLLKEVRLGLHRRMGKKMCSELHADCLDEYCADPESKEEV